MLLRRPSEVLAERLDAVVSFQTTYSQLVEMTQVESSAGLDGSYRVVKQSAQDEFSRLRAKATEQAGAAVQALRGEVVIVEHFGRRYDPVMNWPDSLNPEGGLASTDEVTDALATAVGRLRYQLDQAERDESTWAFRIGWFISLPRRASAAAGGGGLGRFAFASTIVGQIAIGLIVAALVASITWGVAELL